MNRTVLLAIAAFALASAPAAEQPRSAIPWLSHSIETSATAPPRPRPIDLASASPDSNGITVTPLGAVSRDSVGILPPEQTGFARDLWGSTTAAQARSLVLGLPDRGVPETRALFRRILLAEADPPDGAAAGSALLVARIDRLLEIGALEEADALIALAGPDNPEIFRRWFDVGLLLGRAGPPCEALRRNPSLSPTLQARVFCLARGGDWNAAEITLTLGNGMGAIPPEEERLLARFLDPEIFEGEAGPPVPVPLTTLDFVLREAVGLPRPAGLLPVAFLHEDLGEHSPMRARIQAGERLAVSGAIAPAALFAAYRAGRPAASGGPWDRAAAVQALDAALAAGSGVGPALVAADAALRGRGLRVAFAQVYAAALEALDPDSLDATSRQTLVEVLLLSDATGAARAAAGPTPAPTVATLLAIAGAGPAASPAPTGDLPRAALAGVTVRPPEGERETRLAALVEDGRQAEAILAALDLLSAGPAVDPAALQAALFALVAAGQDASARRIALQTLLLQGGS